MPNLNEERKLWKKGYERVAGLDEAGRGALAGPVVAAAVIISPKFRSRNRKKILNTKHILDCRFRALDFTLKDSKKLAPEEREKLYKILIDSPLIEWGIGKASEKVVDKINILEATKLAMGKALKNLERKLKLKLYPTFYDRRKQGIVDFLLVDGNFKIEWQVPQKSIVKADEKVFSCAAASIIAKVTRDRIMMRYHKKYPKYRFDLHKGYGTKFHLRMLKKHGRCAIHRKSFKY